MWHCTGNSYIAILHYRMNSQNTLRVAVVCNIVDHETISVRQSNQFLLLDYNDTEYGI